MATPNIVHITTFQRAGSGIAAMRLHKALMQSGYHSRFLFLYKGIDSETEYGYRKQIFLFHLLLRILKKVGLPLNLEQRNDYSIRKYKYQMELFSFSHTPYQKLHEHPWIQEADVIHLHFIADFIDFKTFFGNIKKSIVWTLHDMNPFQGGFHYTGDIARFGAALQKLDTEQFTDKKKALHQLPANQLTITTPSEWLLHLSEQSEMLRRFPHVAIPNCINTKFFTASKTKTPYKKGSRKLNVLFVAESLHNMRKGFDFVAGMLTDTAVTDACSFTAVGYVKTSLQLPSVTYTGIISSETEMSRLYNEADVFLLPSREDNLPNSMVESLCCGTPVVGFAIGGLTETIRNGENGYLSEDVSTDGLKSALFALVNIWEQLNTDDIKEKAHRKFSEEAVVSRFARLYEKSFRRQNGASDIEEAFQYKT